MQPVQWLLVLRMLYWQVDSITTHTTDPLFACNLATGPRDDVMTENRQGKGMENKGVGLC